MVQAISESGAANGGVSSVSINVFGVHPIVRYGTDEQKQRWLPPVMRREERACFAVTEPDAGLDTTQLSTRAVRDGDRYLVYGQKIWTTTAQVADKIMLIARTAPKEETDSPIDGLSLFYADFDRDYAEVKEIPKMGRKCVDSNSVFFDGMPIPVEDRIGEEGKGFRYLLHGLNPERILLAACAAEDPGRPEHRARAHGRRASDARDAGRLRPHPWWAPCLGRPLGRAKPPWAPACCSRHLAPQFLCGRSPASMRSRAAARSDAPAAACRS